MPSQCNITVSYVASTNKWTIRPCSLPIEPNPTFPTANPVTIIMCRQTGETWTFVSINELNEPEFSWVLSPDATYITITDRRTDRGENPYTVSINASNGPQTSPKNLCSGRSRKKGDKKDLTDAPPIIMNQ